MEEIKNQQIFSSSWLTFWTEQLEERYGKAKRPHGLVRASVFCFFLWREENLPEGKPSPQQSDLYGRVTRWYEWRSHVSPPEGLQPWGAKFHGLMRQRLNSWCPGQVPCVKDRRCSRCPPASQHHPCCQVAASSFKWQEEGDLTQQRTGTSRMRTCSRGWRLDLRSSVNTVEWSEQCSVELRAQIFPGDAPDLGQTWTRLKPEVPLPNVWLGVAKGALCRCYLFIIMKCISSLMCKDLRIFFET